MAIAQGQKSVRTRNVKDNELILMASNTVATGTAKTTSTLAIPPNHWYALHINMTDINATGDNAAVTFAVNTSSDSTMTCYEQQFLKTVSQASGVSPTATLITDAMLPLPFYLAFNPGSHTYVNMVVTTTETGGTITAEAWLVPFE